MNRWMISLVLFAAACGGKKDEPTPTTGSAPAAGSAAATGSATPAAGSAVAAGSGSAVGSAAAPVVAKDADLPTAEDFEEDSTKRITVKNVETEVKALEKEIGEN